MNKPLQNPGFADAFGEPLGISWQDEGDEWIHHLRRIIAAGHGGNLSREDP